MPTEMAVARDRVLGPGGYDAGANMRRLGDVVLNSWMEGGA
jgi:hypothetical protein